jgi:outer membrane lipoprotein carrier protein
MRAILLALMLGVALPDAGASENGVDALLAALAPVKHLQGSFTQRQYGHDEQLLVESTGRFRLLRPGYFSWEIQRPDSQLIIADPDYVWHHDRDLETVTRRPVSLDGEGTPFQILGGDAAALRERFTVQQREPGSFRVSPLSDGAGFKELTLSLEGGNLSSMEITDNLDQAILIEFSDLDSAVELTPSDFAFSPPAGVDTFYYDQ